MRFHNIFGPLGTWEGGREKAPAAMCRKVAVAKLTGNPEVEIWGDGEQTRSFCYIDDCVTGIYKLMRSDYAEPLNLGQDRLVSINQLADLNSSTPQGKCPLSVHAGKGRQAAEIRFPLCVELFSRDGGGDPDLQEARARPAGGTRAELGQHAASRGSPLGAPDLAGGGAAARTDGSKSRSARNWRRRPSERRRCSPDAALKISSRSRSFIGPRAEPGSAINSAL